MQACFHAGDYPSAVAAAAKAEPLLWTSPASFEGADYHFYAGLARAAHHDIAVGTDRDRDREALAAHHKQTAAWAQKCVENFESRAALLAAEIARIEGRDLEAMRLYEEAIRSARKHGFVQNEGLANELAARFSAARSLETAADAYLRNARSCYLRWGADGKVRQLDDAHPHLQAASPASISDSTSGTPLERLDLATVVKVSQALSSEIDLEKLIDVLMTTALEHAGADRGLLVLSRGASLWIEAEATVSGESVGVRRRDAAVAGSELPESVLHYVFRTRESLLLDDAAEQDPFARDEYIRQTRCRSILCLPLTKQSQMVGALYLENKRASRVFTPGRVSLLRLLASQAAISLENAHLYHDLAERESRIRRLVDSNVIGIVIWDLDGRLVDANDAFLRMVQYDREDLKAGLAWFDMTPPEWQARVPQELAELEATGMMQPCEKEFLQERRQPRARPDRRRGLRRAAEPGGRLHCRSDRAPARRAGSARKRETLSGIAGGAGSREPRRHHGAAIRLDRS